MDKPRPRDACPIVDKPEIKSKLMLYSEWTFTTILWTLYVYLLMPIVTLILWIFGVKIMYVQLFEQSGFTQMLEVIWGGGQIALVIILSFFIWSYYNYLIFRIRGERRNRQVLISQDEELAKAFNINPDLLPEAKEHHRFFVNLENGMTIKFG